MVPTCQRVMAELDGLSMVSAVLVVCSVTINTATVPITSHTGGEAVFVMTSIGPCEPIITAVNRSGSVNRYHISIRMVNKAIVDQAVEGKITTFACEFNADQIQTKLKTMDAVKIHVKLKPYA